MGWKGEGTLSTISEMLDRRAFLERVGAWGRELGFSQIGVAPVDLSTAEPGLQAWLDAGCHGSMGYMARHGLSRARPAERLPGAASVITARMDYLPRHTPDGWQAMEWQRLSDPQDAVVSLYARGRDYHKVLRRRLQTLADRMQQHIGPFGHRVCCDSAPLLEAELAVRSGIGWRGRHTLVLHRDAGSMFFLGEIVVDLDLPPSEPVSEHCGQCRACLDACPTGAIVEPYRVDARRCLSYWSIEHAGVIPVPWRRAMGNRVYGCDDCQLACPWNKYAQPAVLADFDARWPAQRHRLLDWLGWDEATFLQQTEGSAMRRLGHARWLRNLAVVAGNALASGALPAADGQALRAALSRWADHASPVVREQVLAALDERCG